MSYANYYLLYFVTNPTIMVNIIRIGRPNLIT